MDKKKNLIALYKEGIRHLEEDFNNVITDTGRTSIADAIEEYKRMISKLETG